MAHADVLVSALDFLHRLPRLPAIDRPDMPQVRFGIDPVLVIEAVILQAEEMDVALVVDEAGLSTPLSLSGGELEQVFRLRPCKPVVLGECCPGDLLLAVLGN